MVRQWQRSMAATVAGAGAAVAMVLGSGAALAQTAEQAINFRKGAMQVAQWHFAPLVQMVKGSRPFDVSTVQRNAEVIGTMSRVYADAFSPISEKSEKIPSRALQGIWGNPAAFKTELERFQAEAGKLVQVSKSGDEKAIRAQIADVARNCASCHDNFRSK